jgi:hypothetical protein
VTERLSRGVMRLSGLFSHAFSDSLDALVLVLQRVVFRQSPERQENKVADTVSYRLGEQMDAVSRRMGRTRPEKPSHAMSFYTRHKRLRKAVHSVTGNLSFALLMLVLAICFVFAYLLWFS